MQNPPSAPSSLDDLAAYIASEVKDHFNAAKQATNGASLAEKIRHKFPEFRYEHLGILKLADAIAYGEAKGYFVRNRSVKHLEILPVSAAEPVAAAVSHLGQAATVHIRPDIWRAFVFVVPGQSLCYDRQTSVVVNSSSVADDELGNRYVPIPAIGLQEQQQWMAQFVESKAGLNINDAPIYDSYCFVNFPAWLNEKEPGLDRMWKRYRVDRVAERVRKWAIESAVDSSVFFSMPIGNATRYRVSEAVSDDAVVRSAISLAARELPIEKLQEISIPIRFVLQALKSR